MLLHLASHLVPQTASQNYHFTVGVFAECVRHHSSPSHERSLLLKCLLKSLDLTFCSSLPGALEVNRLIGNYFGMLLSPLF